MSELKQLKQQLINDSLLFPLLESMGCTHIKTEQGGTLITCCLPSRFESPNRRAVQVRLTPFLSCTIRNCSDFQSDKGLDDIFSLVSYLEFRQNPHNYQKNLPQAKDYILKTLGLSFNHYGLTVNKDYIKTHKTLEKEVYQPVYTPNEVLNETILNEYFYKGKPLPNQLWIDEGISYEVQELFEVGFDEYSRRMTFPIRNQEGQLVGVKGRLYEEEDVFSDRKYLYLHKCDNSKELFHYYRALPFIKEQQKVYVFEGEKSVMKAVGYGDDICVSVGSSDITSYQVETLKALNVEVILCYDKDKSWEEILKQANKLTSVGVETFVMYDRNDLLQGKDAPVDQGRKTWEALKKQYCYMVENEEEG